VRHASAPELTPSRRTGPRPCETQRNSRTNRVASIGNGYGYGLGIGAGPVTRLNVTTSPSGEGSSQLMTGMIEAHTDLRPGASGGAMVNTAGEVIGVDTGTGTAPDTTRPNGYGYAIPINAALDVANELLAGN
jgi:S1-C subfamily serine protease